MWHISVEDRTGMLGGDLVSKTVFKAEIENVEDKEIIHSLCKFLRNIYPSNYCYINVWKTNTTTSEYWPNFPN